MHILILVVILSASEWQDRRLDGTGQRGTIPGLIVENDRFDLYSQTGDKTNAEE